MFKVMRGTLYSSQLRIGATFFSQIVCSLCLIFFLSLTCVQLKAQTALEIIRKAEDKVRGESTESEMTIQIVRPKWTRDMSLKSWTMGRDYSIILITAPARDAGNVTLKRQKEVWNWIPSIERNIKLPPSMMMQSWMGTDFTNDDLVRESSMEVDYSHKILGSESLSGRDCWKLELVAKPDAPVVWGKIIVWIDKKDYLQLKSEMYDEDGFLVNTMKGSDIREMDGRVVLTRMELIPEDKPGNKTVMIYKSLKYDIDISEDFFTTQNMKRIK